MSLIIISGAGFLNVYSKEYVLFQKYHTVTERFHNRLFKKYHKTVHNMSSIKENSPTLLNLYLTILFDGKH